MTFYLFVISKKKKKKEWKDLCVVISCSVECWRAWVTAIQADIDYDNGAVKKTLGDCYCTPVYE